LQPPGADSHARWWWCQTAPPIPIPLGYIELRAYEHWYAANTILRVSLVYAATFQAAWNRSLKIVAIICAMTGARLIFAAATGAKGPLGFQGLAILSSRDGGVPQ